MDENPDEEPKYMVVTRKHNAYKVRKQLKRWVLDLGYYTLMEGDIGEVVVKYDNDKTVMRFIWQNVIHILVKNENMREATPEEVTLLKDRMPFSSFKITGGKKRSSRTRTTRKTRHQNIQVRRAGRRTNKHRRDRRRNAKK